MTIARRRRTWWRWTRLPVARDMALVGALAAGSLLWGSSTFLTGKASLLFGAHQGWAVTGWWSATVAGLAVLPLRHRYPVAVCAVTGGMVVVHMAYGWAPLPADAAVLVAIFAVVVHRCTAVSVAVLVGALAVVLGWSTYVDRASPRADVRVAFAGSARPVTMGKATTSLPPTDWGGFPILGLTVVLAWMAGQSSRQRRAYLDSVLQHARDAERDRTRQAQLAAAVERARISRELHDSVAHGLSVMVIQAQGAAATLDADVARTRRALDAVVATGRQSMDEMRRLLGLLRDPDADGVAWEPQPGVADLPILVARLRQAGLPVDFAVEDMPDALPGDVDACTYRMAQEALTNVLKHAGPGATATVRLGCRRGALVLEVTDNGTGSRPVDEVAHPPGHGLAGIRERVAMLGGELVAGPAPDGGFRVHVCLPVETS